jgi:acetylornithine deacetylase
LARHASSWREVAILDLLKSLVSIDSVNPSLVPGARGEGEAAQFVHTYLRERGVPAELQEAAPGRPNVVAWLGPAPSSSGGGKPRAALAIVAHLDTVGAADMPQPFSPHVQNGCLYGRGALDIKSGVAAMCAAAISLARGAAPLARPLLVAAVVDEECDSRGTQALLERYTADAAVVLEPTDLQIGVAHKGYAWFEISSRGRAAHGSLPEEGRDAIRMMGRVLALLDALDRKLAQAAPHPRLGRASLHASLISGGAELSSYPAECHLQIERRTLPGETDAQVEAELRTLLDGLATRDPDFRATLRRLAARSPYEIAPRAPLVTAAAEALRECTGSAPLAGLPFWTDTALLAAAEIPGIVFGPRGRGLHGPEEYVELESVAVCTELLRRLAVRSCAT